MERSWLIVPDFNRLEESVALAAEYGAAFEYDDFYAPAVYEDEREVERRVAAYLALERDRSADTLHGVFFDINPNSLDSVMRNRSRALMRQSLAIANRLGVRGVVFHSDIYGGMRLSIPPEVWLNSAEELFRQLCAENPGLSIYLENTIEQEPDQLVALAQRMADVPNFALALDYAHASLSATDGAVWLREMGPYVRHVHLNDNDLYADRHWPVGAGSIDYPRFAALADRHIPGVPMLMEVRTLEDARTSLQAMTVLQPAAPASAPAPEALDSRTPYNGSHTRKVARYARLIAQQLNAGQDTPEGDHFNTKRLDQLVMAALLHDIGKMVIPTAVMDKPTRLGAELDAVLAHIQLLQDRQRLAFYEGRLSASERDSALLELGATRELVLEANSAGFVSQETADALRAAAQRTYWSGEEQEHSLTPQQVEKLCIAKGTLTAQERAVMEGHVEMTRRILAEVHFNEDFAQAPVFATQHHEFLDGSGYPLGLTAAELPLESRILAVADIADALMADDRPYKKAMPAERAFGILHSMAAEGKLSEPLVRCLEQALANEREQTVNCKVAGE
ncbi:MAG: HD domain-containing phosphohydrolase [Coriobacteriales bacterium]